jgi:hypothetical protein
LGENQLKTGFLFLTHLRIDYNNWNQIFIFILKTGQDGFSHENSNPVLKVREGKWVGWN